MPSHFLTPVLRRASTMNALRFFLSRFDNIEDVEGYQPGGGASENLQNFD